MAEQREKQFVVVSFTRKELEEEWEIDTSKMSDEDLQQVAELAGEMVEDYLEISDMVELVMERLKLR